MNREQMTQWLQDHFIIDEPHEVWHMSEDELKKFWGDHYDNYNERTAERRYEAMMSGGGGSSQIADYDFKYQDLKTNR